jgi:hypothetical protein
MENARYNDQDILRVFEIKLLEKIFGPKREEDSA